MVDLPYDAILLVSFGGPEGPDDVIPFLENVTRGRGIPRERLAQVGEHYAHFGGVSPINEQCRRQRVALEAPSRTQAWTSPSTGAIATGIPISATRSNGWPRTV